MIGEIILEKVCILMAIYKPNMQWLIEQLESLNAQTYKNIELIVYNDCPDDEVNYETIYEKHITNFEFSIVQGEANLGSTLAFGKLTEMANGEYIAYCDQDDVWLPNKLEILVNEIKRSNADLICSDMYVIDANSNIVADSITKVRPRYIFYNGNNVFENAIIHNWVTGCTVLIKTEMAKKALPFPKKFVHDVWLAAYTGAYGKIVNLNKSLIKYRIHGNNQTLVLAGINNKDDYYIDRIKGFNDKIDVIQARFNDRSIVETVCRLKKFANARNNYYTNVNLTNFCRLFRLRRENRSIVYFELFLPFIPSVLFKFLIKQIRRGKI